MTYQEGLKREIEKCPQEETWRSILFYGTKAYVNICNMQGMQLDCIKIYIEEDVLQYWVFSFRGCDYHLNVKFKLEKLPENDTERIVELEEMAEFLKTLGFCITEIKTEYNRSHQDFVSYLIGQLDFV